MNPSICVFAGANPGNNPQYAENARLLGQLMAEKNDRLIFGGSSIGLMGELADSILLAGGEAIGVMPQGLVLDEMTHTNLTQLIKVSNMHQRKKKMIELADAFIALPGGIGTFDEIFEILCLAQVGSHKKPMALLNSEHYFEPLLQLIRHSIAHGFTPESNLRLLIVSEDPAELLVAIDHFVPPSLGNKWKQYPNAGKSSSKNV
ncbi:TIGR00730 family Rossman fold protein [Sporolactobacillus spathodeae]|uniref:Cytokinin riboside 5'-monophosphate phosphoribohydrolase n=1 Tax=Sporolactobacillus spathodeae TaxID=1465502 RepID=A0ABS2Q796_9BACL|nr:TIGR00730 family Rossman fold protein [Sporolactobacillus spathodeae]MBM7657613.1 uncharacterized protein (TIGR00730 family) [Sporolactobacillus spathodeae]